MSVGLLALLAACGGGGGGGGTRPPPSDTTPDAFVFAAQTGVAPSAAVTSNEVAIAGIDAGAPVGVTGGEYSIDGAAFSSAAGTVTNTQRIRVRVTSAAQFATAASATLTVGGVAGTFTVTTRNADVTPDAFQFAARTGVERGIAVSSDPATIAGIDIAVPISVANGEYSIVGGPFTSAAGTVANGQTVRVRVTSSAGFATATTATLTVGGVAATFTATTRSVDTTPDAFQFAARTRVARSTAVVSDPATISGIDVAASISVANGEYSIAGGPFTNTAGTVSNGQSVRVRVTSAAVFETATSATLTVGGVPATFTVTTRAGDTTPDAFQFPRQDGVAAGELIVSAPVMLTGFEAAAISVENGEYSIAGGDFTATPGTIELGQSLRVRVRSDQHFLWSAHMRATVGGVSAEFEVVTGVPQYLPADVAFDGQDTIYLLVRSPKQVARWSLSGARYLESLALGARFGTPGTLAYSSAHRRLYIGYDTADIRYLDLATANPAEVQFANVEPNVIGPDVPSIVAAGNYLAAQEHDLPWESHYVFDAAGAQKAHASSIYSSKTLAYDATNARVYYFRDGLSPNDVHYDAIDPATGAITGAGESPYHGVYGIAPPIRIQDTGPYLVLGSGDVYRRSDLTWASSLGAELADARWMANGALVTLATVSNQTVLKRLSGATFRTVAEQRAFDGEPLRVLGTDSRMAVLVKDGATVKFHVYVPNDDADGDGVPNGQDAFPRDPAASVDSDRDGYPNAWNANCGPNHNTACAAGDSNSGLALDAFPQDSGCWLTAHGSGGVCNPASTVPAFVPEQVAQQGDVIYLLSAANRRVYRWSIGARAYVNPYVVGYEDGAGGITAPTQMSYSPSHQRLYLAYLNGVVRYVDVGGNGKVEIPYASVSGNINGLAAVGNYVLVQDTVPPWGYSGTRTILDRDGVVTFSQSAAMHASEYAWDPVLSRVYFIIDSVIPNNLYYMVVNQTTGQVTSSFNSPYHGTYPFLPPIRVTNDGQSLVLGTGAFFRQSDLTWTGTLGAPIVDARWNANGTLNSLTSNGSQTTLRRQNVGTLEIQEQVTYPGQALRVVGSDTLMVVLTTQNGAVLFNIHVPTNDSDSDGVANTQDAFPFDVAASVDTDRDGYPDAWNGAVCGPGHNVPCNASHSTTGLSLDAYPNDSGCWLAAHGSGGVCNPASTVPAYVPDQVLGEGNVIYLLSRTQRRVYRWSMVTRQYLNPYVVGIDDGFTRTPPVRIAYSAAHQRLYAAYANGVVRYIASGGVAETPFVMLPGGLTNVAAVGNFLLAQDADTQNGVHTVLDAAGAIRATRADAWRTNEFTWDPVRSRAYFTRDSVTPNDLEWEVVDQTTGAITSWGDSPYHGDFPVEGPVRVSADGSRIVIGSGYLQAGDGLGLLGSLGKFIRDAHWKDFILVTVDMTAKVEIRDADTRAVLISYQHGGTPLRLVFGTADAYLVNTVAGATMFQRLAFQDQDGDQMPLWWEQAYNFSDADAANATSDPDGDGVNNRNEYLGHSNPRVADTDGDGLNDFQELVTYSTNPANVDSDGDGLRDGAEVNTHHSNPNDTDSDDDGFSDFIEVLYGGNATNAGVLPQPLTAYSQGFEGTPNLAAWSTPPLSDTTWSVVTGAPHAGTQSLGASAGSQQNSKIQWTGYFARGFLTFQARVNGNSCCDQIEVFVDGQAIYRTSQNNVWQEGFAQLDPGVHTVEFRYRRDDFVNGAPAEGGWIDDILFDDF